MLTALFGGLFDRRCGTFLCCWGCCAPCLLLVCLLAALSGGFAACSGRALLATKCSLCCGNAEAGTLMNGLLPFSGLSTESVLLLLLLLGSG